MKKHPHPSDFTRLLNLFHKADRPTMRVIAKTLNAQARHNNMAEDFGRLWDDLAATQMDMMDIKDAGDAERIYEDFERRLRNVTRTIAAMKNATKAILNVRFPTRANRAERSRY
jgi:hypothetical protein